MGANNILDYHKLMVLNQKVQTNTATKVERDEYMLMLYNNNSISRKQYDDYLAGRNNEELFDSAITIGGIVLLGYLLGKMFSK
jgi:hypothetical protein